MYHSKILCDSLRKHSNDKEIDVKGLIDFEWKVITKSHESVIKTFDLNMFILEKNTTNRHIIKQESCTCLCGKRHLKKIFEIYNTKNENSCIIGSTCIKKFLNDSKKKELELIERCRRAEKNGKTVCHLCKKIIVQKTFNGYYHKKCFIEKISEISDNNLIKLIDLRIINKFSIASHLALDKESETYSSYLLNKKKIGLVMNIIRYGFKYDIKFLNTLLDVGKFGIILPDSIEKIYYMSKTLELSDEDIKDYIIRHNGIIAEYIDKKNKDVENYFIICNNVEYINKRSVKYWICEMIQKNFKPTSIFPLKILYSVKSLKKPIDKSLEEWFLSKVRKIEPCGILYDYIEQISDNCNLVKRDKNFLGRIICKDTMSDYEKNDWDIMKYTISINPDSEKIFNKIKKIKYINKYL